MIKFITAGESHGKGIVAVIEGIPAHLRLGEEDINVELKRRQMGYGRGARMKIELDRAEILSGVRKGETLGSPIAVAVWNRDWHNKPMSPVFVPRPGHADLAGALKYSQQDIRNVWERASARETAGRVAAGAVARKLLGEFGIEILSHIVGIGYISIDTTGIRLELLKKQIKSADKAPVRCVNKEAAKEMIRQIDEARAKGDTLGGMFEIIALGVPAGLGTYVQWDARLDMKLAGALMSIPGIRGVEIGLGFESAGMKGSEVHDEIAYKGRFTRKTNNAGGIEGGISNGEPIILRAAMKPIPSLAKPLWSVNLKTKRSAKAPVLRADVCAVPAAGVVGEAMAAIELASAMTDRFSGDTLQEMKRHFKA
ncbi:chorismate synthase [Candidatus Desantisbacteria bacterium CG_4_10_14_0_8_um_filter_48_22]|uniref:Chorismate synthase n=1 Tax=Candidatus Desantisbacteria bacterium CG_4_10_14_0_8_um_filter_48_22 TaxID=1974543 RepID=A0A2M7SAV5_9BACT|nr:MAG: chorismate synthase [Candidatus Desantisbacteria bacterium CG1_02_49_89]PIV55751.1 MAG: chorismate synthase [Candidatus Desantisbacteria bacterium CG02_land_8_20_14_3_00_49_13]PIZ16677.1 MAG: chorismate synthase [Candidatus Desantisbacteria bacterium CG_4_10_14_0_8_um_filter_48_22]